MDAFKPSHDHNNASASHHAGTEKSESDDCCKDSAVKFQKEDKKVQQSQNIAIKAPVFVAFLSAFLGLDLAPQISKAGTPFLIPSLPTGMVAYFISYSYLSETASELKEASPPATGFLSPSCTSPSCANNVNGSIKRNKSFCIIMNRLCILIQ